MTVSRLVRQIHAVDGRGVFGADVFPFQPMLMGAWPAEARESRSSKRLWQPNDAPDFNPLDLLRRDVSQYVRLAFGAYA